jgi:hypothetical protein
MSYAFHAAEYFGQRSTHAEVAAYNLGSCQRSADTSLFQCKLRQFGAALRPACVC